jgi:hypothetical protein
MPPAPAGGVSLASWFGPEMRLRNRFITIAIKDSRKTQKLGSSIERLFHRE